MLILLKADPQSDYFTTEYHENDQSLDINFQTLNFNLYKVCCLLYAQAFLPDFLSVQWAKIDTKVPFSKWVPPIHYQLLSY